MSLTYARTVIGLPLHGSRRDAERVVMGIGDCSFAHIASVGCLYMRILYFINGRSVHWRVLLEIAESAFRGRRFDTPGLLIHIGSIQLLRGIVVPSHIDALPYLRDTTHPIAVPSRGRCR